MGNILTMFNIFAFLSDPFISIKTKLLYIGLPLLLLMIIIIFLTSREKFSNFHHRSNLASTFWMTKPQIQHSFQDLALQYPDHYDYFKNSCHEKEPNNAELCRYHKHRFDPNQL